MREFESHGRQVFFFFFQLTLYNYKVFFIMICNYGKKNNWVLSNDAEKEKKKVYGPGGIRTHELLHESKMS